LTFRETPVFIVKNRCWLKIDTENVQEIIIYNTRFACVCLGALHQSGSYLASN